jgi:hypothetical protein
MSTGSESDSSAAYQTPNLGSPRKAKKKPLHISQGKMEMTGLPVSITIPVKESEGSSSQGTIGTAMATPPAAYVKTVQRRGNTYLIHDSLPSEEDPAEADTTYRMCEDLYRDTIELSIQAYRKSSLHKILYVLVNLFIIVAGAAIIIISIPGRNYPSMVLGALISGSQTMMSTFSIEKRGVLLRDTAGKLRRVSRQVKTLQASDMKRKDKLKEINKLYDEVDELDLHMFDNSITPEKLNAASANLASAVKRDDSDLHSSEQETWYESRNSHKKDPAPAK